MDGLSVSFSTFSILSGVDGQTQQAIAACAHERTYRAGEMIVLAGEPTRAVYLVARGRVRSQRSSTEGREVVLHDLGPGEGFNLTSALDGGHSLATVTAISKVLLYVIPAADFRRIANDHPAFLLAMLPHLARRVRHLSDAVEGLALHDVRIRLARCLLSHTQRAEENALSPHSDWPCPSYLTQDEIAAQIGTVRDVVGRTLRRFTREGLVRRERGRVVVTDLAGLRREALRDQGVWMAS